MSNYCALNAIRQSYIYVTLDLGPYQLYIRFCPFPSVSDLTKRCNVIWSKVCRSGCAERKWSICTLLNLAWPCTRVMSFQNCNFSTNFSFQVSKPFQLREHCTNKMKDQTLSFYNAHYKAACVWSVVRNKISTQSKSKQCQLAPSLIIV